MSSTTHKEPIIQAILALGDSGQRVAFLDLACRGNPQLRAEIEQEVSLRQSAQSQPGEHSPGESYPVTMPIVSPIEAAGKVIGRYRLLEQIGEGGMGIVFLAEQHEPVHRRVALKIIKPGMDTAQVIARFEQERQALAMMDHPNIAKVLDAGTTDAGRPYFVMELVKGIPLTQYCDQTHLPPPERLELFMQVCRAVQHAHQKGIIHRDLKPSNVLVALYDGQPVPKVIDFGVAKATSSRLTQRTMYTQIGSVIGTIEYMAPEQAELNNLDIDTRADIYSLGVILYELLTSTPPFSAKQLRSEAYTEMLRLIREVEPPRPSTRLSTLAELPSIAANRKLEPKRLAKLLQGDLDWIVMKALDKDRSRRYETANAFAADLERFLKNEAVEAGPPSPTYRFRKFVYRYHRLIAVTMAMVMLLVAAAAISAWQAVVASRAKVIANEQRDVATKAEGLARDERDRAVAAEKRAQQEAFKANTEAAIAAAVNNFLREDLLGQASARKQASLKVKPDPNLTVKTALDRAAQRVAGRFDKQPYVEVAIRRTIGWSYRDLGDIAAAQGQFERALEILRTIRKPGDLELLDLTSDVAMIYRLQGKYRESVTLCRQILDDCRRVSGENHPITLRATGALANALVADGTPDEAERLLVAAIESGRKLLGEENLQIIVFLNTLGNIYKDKSNYSEALKLYTKVLDFRQRTLGEDHPDTLSVMNNIAIVYKLQGEFEKAKQLYERVLDSRRRFLGEDHPNTLSSVNNLALLLLDQARYAEAERILEDALKLAKLKLGDDHPMCLNIMDNLAELLDWQERHEPAVLLFEKVLALRRDKIGEEHPDTMTTMHGLAIAQANHGNMDEAKRLLNHVIQVRRRIQGNKHPDLAAALDELGKYELKTGHYAEAEPLLREAVGILRQHLANNWRRFDTETKLAASLLGQKKFEEAERLLIPAFDELQSRWEAISVPERQNTTNSLQLIIDLYVAQSRDDKASEWRKKLSSRP